MMDLINTYVNFEPQMTVETYTTYPCGLIHTAARGPDAPTKTIEDRLTEIVKSNVIPGAITILRNDTGDPALKSMMLIYPGPKAPENAERERLLESSD